MASSTDFKSLWDRYQQEGVSKEISIVKFCQMNGVVYSHFEKWYKHFKSATIVPVKILGLDQNLSLQDSCPVATERLKESISEISSVNLTFSNGMKVHHRNLDYWSLKLLIEKLEALC